MKNVRNAACTWLTAGLTCDAVFVKNCVVHAAAPAATIAPITRRERRGDRNSTHLTEQGEPGILRASLFINVELKILYEDNHVIAVYKPAGILVQEDKTGDPSLLDQVKYYLKNKYHKPGNVFLGLVHRLDRPVSGIIIFGKTSKGSARLSEQIRNHEMEKVYHALVAGKPLKERGVLVHYIKKNPETNKVEIRESPFEGSLSAELSYEVVKTNGKFSILKIYLKTGRPHQIRSQLSSVGCPILGDVKYGGPANEFLALSSTYLKFRTATGDEIKELSLPYPTEWDDYL